MLFKNPIFISLIFIFSIIPLKAQMFFGGIKGGIVGSQVSGDNASGFNKAGIDLAVYSGFPIENRTSIQMEIHYIQKGSRVNPKPEKYINKYLLRLNYVEIPIIYTWQGNETFEIEGGLSYGYLIKNTDVEFDDNGLISGQIDFKKYEISFHFGMNYIIRDNLKTNLRFSNSILPIRPHASGATYLLNFGQYNTLFTLGLTYQFGNNE